MTILPNYDNATPERGAFLPLTGRLAITLGACRSRLRGDLLPGRWSIFRAAARLWGSGVSPVCLWVSPPAALALARRSRSFLGTRVPVAGRFSAGCPLSEIGGLAGLSAVPALRAGAAVWSVWLCSERQRFRCYGAGGASAGQGGRQGLVRRRVPFALRIIDNSAARLWRRSSFGAEAVGSDTVRQALCASDSPRLCCDADRSRLGVLRLSLVGSGLARVVQPLLWRL
jgi:hypothetical protein